MSVSKLILILSLLCLSVYSRNEYYLKYSDESFIGMYINNELYNVNNTKVDNEYFVDIHRNFRECLRGILDIQICEDGIISVSFEGTVFIKNGDIYFEYLGFIEKLLFLYKLRLCMVNLDLSISTQTTEIESTQTTDLDLSISTQTT